MRRSTQNRSHEMITFVLTLAFGICVCWLLSSTMPLQKRAIDYLAQGLFSSLLAVPTGVAWRSLRKRCPENHRADV